MTVRDEYARCANEPAEDIGKTTREADSSAGIHEPPSPPPALREPGFAPKSSAVDMMWIEEYRRMLEDRLNRLGEFLERTKGEEET